MLLLLQVSHGIRTSSLSRGFKVIAVVVVHSTAFSLRMKHDVDSQPLRPASMRLPGIAPRRMRHPGFVLLCTSKTTVYHLSIFRAPAVRPIAPAWELHLTPASIGTRVLRLADSPFVAKAKLQSRMRSDSSRKEACSCKSHLLQQADTTFCLRCCKMCYHSRHAVECLSQHKWHAVLSLPLGSLKQV